MNIRKHILPVVFLSLIPLFVHSADDSNEPELIRVKLDQPQVIQGIPCQRFAWYFKDGSLQSSFLSEPFTLSGHDLPTSTKFHFNLDGTLDFCFLGKDHELDGHLCLGRGHGYMTTFHPNGQLHWIWLARDEVIDGIPCRHASFWADAFMGGVSTRFHPNGRLKTCKLSEAITIQGRELKKGEHPVFDETGKLLGTQKEVWKE
ncbi:hypothetical protein K8I28_05075 [bacterium]|nr:hypothetical protein [bacterium]